MRAIRCTGRLGDWRVSGIFDSAQSTIGFDRRTARPARKILQVSIGSQAVCQFSRVPLLWPLQTLKFREVSSERLAPFECAIKDSDVKTFKLALLYHYAFSARRHRKQVPGFSVDSADESFSTGVSAPECDLFAIGHSRETSKKRTCHPDNLSGARR